MEAQFRSFLHSNHVDTLPPRVTCGPNFFPFSPFFRLTGPSGVQFRATFLPTLISFFNTAKKREKWRRERFFCSLFFSFLLYVGRSKSYRPNGEKRNKKKRVNTYPYRSRQPLLFSFFTFVRSLLSLSLRHRLCLLAERLYIVGGWPHPNYPPLIEETAYPSPGFLFSSDGELKSHYCIDTHVPAILLLFAELLIIISNPTPRVCVCYTRRRRKVIQDYKEKGRQRIYKTKLSGCA
jgi:hypothetical protein